MSAVPKPTWTREASFLWAEAQDERHAFDGLEPVAMTGGTAVHGMPQRDLVEAIDSRMVDRPCQVPGPDAGIAIDEAVRCPDALITCSPVAHNALTIPGVVIVSEIVSPTSGRLDRVIKVREYARSPPSHAM